MTWGFAASSFTLTVSNGNVGRSRYVALGGSGSASAGTDCQIGASDGKSVISTCGLLESPFRHLASHFGIDSPLPVQERPIHTQHLRLVGFGVNHEAAMQTIAGALAMRGNRRDQAAGGFTSKCRQTAEHRRLATQLAQGCQK